MISLYYGVWYLMEDDIEERVKMKRMKLNTKEMDLVAGAQEPEKEYNKEMKKIGVLVGRGKGVNRVIIEDKKCSSIHCRFKDGRIVDYSSNGTYVSYRYREGYVKIPSNVFIGKMNF